MSDDLICPVNKVRVSIPRKKLKALFSKSVTLTQEEVQFLGRKKDEFEENVLILQHTISVVEKILLKE